MNKREKEVIQAQLDAEKAVLRKLETQYQKALHDIIQKTKLFDADIKTLDELLRLDVDESQREVTESIRQAKIYQKQYQEALKKQVAGILDKLHGDTYATVEQYLKECYNDGYLGAMYDIQGQGIPIVVPIDQQAVTQAVVLDSKVVKGYYVALGVDFDRLKKVIPAEVSRGIASSLSYIDIARNINNASRSGLSNAYRIARTEGHRIQQTATHDAQKAAKAKGADVVKQWDATLDGRTRDTHRKLDGQIREVDEPFEVGGKKAMMPGGFGRPEEDINCRCVSLTRARWALDEDELETLKKRAEFFGLDKTKDFEDFKEKYLKALDNNAKSDIIKSFEVGKSVGASAKKYPVKMPESKQHVKLAEGQHIEGTVFAGKGSKTEIRDRFRLEATYKHPASEWQKVSGNGVVVVDGKNKKAELHWYEAEGEMVEMKVKRFYDED